MRFDAPSGPNAGATVRWHYLALGAPWAAPGDAQAASAPDGSSGVLLCRIGYRWWRIPQIYVSRSESFPLLYFYPWIVSGLPTSAIPIIELAAEGIQRGH